MYARLSHYSWALLGTASLILFFNTGTRFAFGVLLKPMQEDLGWSRSSLSLAMALNMFISALALPLVGRILDRYSMRWALAGAVVIASVGMGLLGWANSMWQFFLLYGVVLALGIAGCSVSPVSVLVSRWFRRGKGLANSIAISGGAAGQLVVIAVLASFLLALGWRYAYSILGLSMLVVVLPLVILVIPSRAPGSRPTDLTQQTPTEPIPQADTSLEPFHRESLRMALGSRTFPLLAVTYFICGFQDWFVGTHLVAFATDEGMGKVLAGNLVALMGIMGMAGVLLAGYLADAYGPAWPTAASFLFRIAIFSLIIGSRSTPAIITFALLYGFTFFMTAPLIPLFVARFFGTTRLGALTGIIAMIHQMGGGLGAYVGGVMFDRLGDYYWAMVTAFAMSLVATVTSVLLLGRQSPQMAQLPEPVDR